jgi:hypothetical protein
MGSATKCPDASWDAYRGRWARCNRRACPGCGQLWARDQRRKLIENVGEAREPVGLVTVTAPGRDAFAHGGDWWLDGELVAWWAKKALAQWRRVQRAAVARAKRRARAAGVPWKVIAHTIPLQRRGLPHIHIVVPMGFAQREISQGFAEDLARGLEGGNNRPGRRHDALWGFVDVGRKVDGRRRLEARESNSAGRYVGRHMAGEREGRNELVAAAVSPLLRGRQLVQVHRELTARTHVTMRTLRERRVLWARARARHEAEAGHGRGRDVIRGLLAGEHVARRELCLEVDRGVRGP